MAAGQHGALLSPPGCGNSRSPLTYEQQLSVQVRFARRTAQLRSYGLVWLLPAAAAAGGSLRHTRSAASFPWQWAP